jgi:lipopolysaccharide/colanic/teichoic acid biosynthesis glycosyltransferase
MSTTSPLPKDTAKRLLDISVALPVLLVTAPIIAVSCALITAQDGHSPLYISQRVGRGGAPFRMFKLRTMVMGADKANNDIVGANDARVTRLGWWLRTLKFDELPQLFNVLKGDISMVGPRPNTPRHVDMLTDGEQELLTIKPGLTDMSSIAFLKQAQLFADSTDTEADYHIRMRPLKSALGVWYARNYNVVMDALICAITAIGIVHYTSGIRCLGALLSHYHAPAALREAVLDLPSGKWHSKTLSEFGL